MTITAHKLAKSSFPGRYDVLVGGKLVGHVTKRQVRYFGTLCVSWTADKVNPEGNRSIGIHDTRKAAVEAILSAEVAR